MDEVKCFMDMSIDGHDAGRIIFKLFVDKCPKTCENFRCLCTGERCDKQTGKPLHYKETPFHRIVKNFMIQGGDITDRNGKGGDSIYGGSFEDENLKLAHDEPYLLSMANRGPDTNRSQFFITTNEAPHLDGKHVVFGRVISGLDTILKIEKQEVDSKSRPVKKVIIKDCGQLTADESPPPPLRADANEPQTTVDKRSSRSPSPRDRPSKRRRSQSSSSRSSSYSSTSSSSSSSSYTSSSSKNSGRSTSSSSSRTSHSSASSSSCSSRTRRHSSDSSSSSSSSSDSNSSASSSGTGSNSSSSDDSMSGTPPRLSTPKSQDVPIEVKKEAEKSEEESEEEEETFVNPHYKCSVKRDEIPEVPVNRFLMRGPTKVEKKKKKKKDDELREKEPEIPEEALPFQIDLSKYEDVPDEDGGAGGSENNRGLRSRVKPTESVVSRSGRVMKGRGNFKFRTPSPQERNNNRRPHSPRYSPPSRRYKRRGSRSRSRSRTPPRKYSRRYRYEDRR